MQAMVTVLAGTLLEMPAAKADSRAMLLVLTSWITVPIITRSIREGLPQMEKRRETKRKEKKRIARLNHLIIRACL